jgi:glutamine cyclotransferase
VKRLLGLIWLLLAVAPVRADTGWTLVRSYPHDAAAFTQGLLYHDGLLYESTGQVGQSDIRIVRLRDGKVLRRVKVPPPYFGEGLVLWKDRLVSLTWRHGRGFIWSLPDLRKFGGFAYDGEGWGITSDGKRLIMSDGTATLRFLDPETLKETGRIRVTWQGAPVAMLNELEYVDGEILANVWMTTRIARIAPASGDVIDWIDLAPLARQTGGNGRDNVLNGIAWDAKGRRLFVTGKYWPKLFEIRLER